MNEFYSNEFFANLRNSFDNKNAPLREGLIKLIDSKPSGDILDACLSAFLHCKEVGRPPKKLWAAFHQYLTRKQHDLTFDSICKILEYLYGSLGISQILLFVRNISDKSLVYRAFLKLTKSQPVSEYELLLLLSGFLRDGQISQVYFFLKEIGGFSKFKEIKWLTLFTELIEMILRSSSSLDEYNDKLLQIISENSGHDYRFVDSIVAKLYGTSVTQSLSAVCQTKNSKLARDPKFLGLIDSDRILDDFHKSCNLPESSGSIVLLFCSSEYRKLGEFCANRLRAIGQKYLIVFMGNDKNSVNFAEHEYHAFLNLETSHELFRDRLWRIRYEIINYLLTRGLNVILSGVDNYFVRSTEPQIDFASYDLISARAASSPHFAFEIFGHAINGDFIAFKACEPTLRLLKICHANMGVYDTDQTSLGNQLAMNYHLEGPKNLDEAVICSGDSRCKVLKATFMKRGDEFDPIKNSDTYIFQPFGGFNANFIQNKLNSMIIASKP